MPVRFAALALWLLPLAALAADALRPTLHMAAEGEVQIAPDGHVSDYRLTSPLAPALAQLIDRHVREWKFEPVLVDGKPVVAKTRMGLQLGAEPKGAAGDQYQVRIEHVDFGAPRRAPGMQPPHYPASAVHAGLGARVLLAIKLDEHGNVAEIQPYQTSLDARANSENEAENWRHLFEQASLIAARRWHFDVSESVDGRPLGAAVIVPIEYSLHGIGGGREVRAGQWKAYVAGPVHAAPWLNPALAANADLSDLKDGEAKALGSQFRLKDDVVGSVL